jgi:carnosine synthase
MEYIEGTEHDVDIIIFQRQLIAAFVSDNGPTRQGRFTETPVLMPSCLLPDREGQLVTAAYQCCTEIGLVDGVFNVEMKMTKTGPNLIEINARMGGFYLRNWILTCYGIDLLLFIYMLFGYASNHCKANTEVSIDGYNVCSVPLTCWTVI